MKKMLCLKAFTALSILTAGMTGSPVNAENTGKTPYLPCGSL
jgi:hypothetical protein